MSELEQVDLWTVLAQIMAKLDVLTEQIVEISVRVDHLTGEDR